MEEYIKLLELPEEFDLNDLKKAYRKKVLKYHPDKASNEAERIGYEALMRKLNEANEYLKEYLENHGGRYTKPTQNDTYSNNAKDTQEENHEEAQEETSYNEDDEVNEDHGEEYEEDTPRQTEPVYKSITIHSKDYKLVFNGKLYLYPDRLIFESNANVVGKYTKVILFDEIKELRKINKLKHVLEILDSKGNIDIFVLDKRHLWLDKIYKFIGENNVPLLEIDENTELAPENPFPELNLLNTNFISEILNTVMFVIRTVFKPMVLLKALKYSLYAGKFKHSLEEVYKGLVKLVLIVLLIPFLVGIFDSMDSTSLQQEEQYQEQAAEDIEEIPQDEYESSKESLNNESSLNSKEAINSYMKDLTDNIYTNWNNKPVSNKIFIDRDIYRTVVSFTIFKDGRLIGEPEIKKSSGIERLDEMALETIKESTPFKPLPKEINRDSLDLEFTFDTKKNPNSIN